VSADASSVSEADSASGSVQSNLAVASEGAAAGREGRSWSRSDTAAVDSRRAATLAAVGAERLREQALIMM